MKTIGMLDSVVEEIIVRWEIPGLGIGIVEGSELVYCRGFGVQSLETSVPVTQDSIFCVGSISKCFVATAVMQLAEQGIVQLDAPLVKYLPSFRMNDACFSQITLRQTLSHTSGMPDMDESEYEALVGQPETDADALERYVRGLSMVKMIAAPGERFFYSNIAYNVLGHLIARISGQTFEDTMQENILLPAGMPDSTFFFPDVQSDRLAVPHLRTPEILVRPVYPYHRADAPASFLHSTIVDMCHWCITCLNQGIDNRPRILSPTSYELMWTPIARRGYPPFYEDAGLGWTLGHFDGVKTVSHGGMGFGWTDFLILLPERKCAAVILCNEESSAREQTLQAVVNVLLDREPTVSAVSWMVPISKALQAGGTQAAYACYEALKESRSEEYFFDADELLNLVYQLISVNKIDLAIDVIGLNLHAFPKHIESYIFLARLFLQKCAYARAVEILRKALSIQPENTAAWDLLQKIHPGS